METPYPSRAVVNENYDGVDIIIPAKKNWLVVVLTGTWLVGVTCFVIFVCTLLQDPGAATARPFIYIFFSLFIIPAIAVINKLWWTIAGKEIIHISQGVLTIQRKGDLFKRTKSYELAQCTNFCAAEVEMPVYHYNNRTAAMLRKRPKPGTISFTYDVVDTIQFGDYLPEAEANYILERLRAKKLIS